MPPARNHRASPLPEDIGSNNVPSLVLGGYQYGSALQSPRVVLRSLQREEGGTGDRIVWEHGPDLPGSSHYRNRSIDQLGN